MYDKTFLKRQSAHNSIFSKQFGFKKIATYVNMLTSRFSPPQNNAKCPPLIKNKKCYFINFHMILWIGVGDLFDPCLSRVLIFKLICPQ